MIIFDENKRYVKFNADGLGFMSYSLPLCRRVFPELLSNKIVRS